MMAKSNIKLVFAKLRLTITKSDLVTIIDANQRSIVVPENLRLTELNVTQNKY